MEFTHKEQRSKDINNINWYIVNDAILEISKLTYFKKYLKFFKLNMTIYKFHNIKYINRKTCDESIIYFNDF